LNLIVKNIGFLFLVVFASINGHSQTTDDIKKEADGLFKEEKFIAAAPLYLQLLNVEPRNHDLNFKYGTCLIYSSQDKAKSIRFLNFSVKSPTINPLAHYYLGKAYHLNYQFSDAIAAYSKYKTVGSQADIKSFKVDASIEACKNGKQLLTNITDMIVLNKTEVKKQDFYELYKLNNIGGTLLITDQFQSKIDKKMGHRPIIYFPQNSPYIFYSSYGESIETGLDIFVKKKLPNGKWSEAIKVVGDVNTDMDEDYPFLSLDGKYLYYSSKGHNSMGGYDVFRSKVIVEGSSFARPENMDFAISSPNDDILYIVDSLDRTAYFSSARESQDGKLYVYEVRVEKIPMQLAVLKGEFINEIDPGNKNVKIEISNFTTGALVGTFNSTPRTGNVLLTLPKSGKYVFEMTVKGSDITHRAEVSVPYIKEFRPLKIDLAHTLNNGQEIIVLKTLFDDRFDDPTAIMAEVYQRISKLEPNANEYNLDSINELRNADNVFAEAGIDKYSTAEDIEILLEKAKNLNQTQKEALEQNSFMAHNIAARKQAEAVSKMKEANELIAKGKIEPDPSSKKNILTSAYKLVSEAESLNKEAVALVNLGSVLEESIKEKDKESVSLNSALLSVKAIDQQDGKALNSFVEKNTAVLSLASNTETKTSVLDQAEKDGKAVKNEYNEVVKKISDFESRIGAIESRIERENEKLATTKKKKEVEAIMREIESAKNELELVEIELNKLNTIKDGYSEDDFNKMAVVDAVGTLKNNKNQNEENKQTVSNAEKLKIKYSVDNQEFLSAVESANSFFIENNISGESINLAGLNESTVKLRNYKTVRQVEDRMDAILDEISTTKSEDRKSALQKELSELNLLKEDLLAVETGVSTLEITKADLVENYTERLNDIVAIKDISKQKMAQADLNKDLKKAADNKIAELNKKDELTDDDKRDLAKLEKLSQEAAMDIKSYEDWKVAIENQDNFADFTYKDALNTVSADYESRVNEIYNSDLSEEEKSLQIKSLNDATLVNTKEKLQEAEALLQANPENALAIKQKRQYGQLIEDLEAKNSIPLSDPTYTSSVSLNYKDVNEDALQPGYSAAISKIRNSAINELDKEKATLNINKTLLEKVSTELKALSSNPEVAKSKEGKRVISELEKLQEEVKEEIESSQAIIAKKVKENPSLENSVESIVEDYTSKSYEINELGSDAEKIAAIESLNSKAILDIEKEIKKTKIANAANPREELQYEINELETLRKELIVNKSKDYYGVVMLDSEEKLSEVKGDATIDDIEPEYRIKMESILQDAVSAKDMERKKIELNEQALAKTNQEIRRIENGIQTVPENKKRLEKRLESLNEIKLILEDKIFESKSIVGDDGGVFSVVVDVEDVNPDYLNTVNKIKEMSENEKNEAVKELNELTVELIERKMTIIEEDLRKNGRDNKKILLLQKYAQLTAEIEANPSIPAKGSVKQDQFTNAVVNNSESTEFPVIYKDVNITDAIPNYREELDSVLSGVKPMEEKERDKINLYNKSIANLQKQAKELETYGLIDSPNKEYAAEKLVNINQIIEVLETEKEESENRIATINNPQRYDGVLDVMPDYETRKEKIEYESGSTVEKLKNTNELNKVLLFEIDNKISELQALQKEEVSETRTENIEKLTELAETVKVEIDNNSNILKASEADADLSVINENKFEPLNPENFKDDLEVAQLNLIKKDVKLIKSFEKDIVRLERKKARLSGNQADKVQKEIDKTIVKQSTLHNRLISDLEGVVDEKLWKELTECKENSVKIKGANMQSDEIRNAEEGILISEAKIEKAKAYRKEAAEIKNQVVANKILLKAAQLEYEAQQLLVNSNATLTTAALVTELVNKQPLVLEVEANEESRTSTELYNLASEIERRAYTAELRAAQLIDSSLTVKKKYRQAIVLEAEELKEEQNRLENKAASLRMKAGEIEDQENAMLAVVPKATNRDVPKAETVQVLKSESYQSYYNHIQNAKSNIEEAESIQQEIEILKAKAAKIIRQAIVVNENATMEDHQSNPEIIKILSEIDKLTQSQKILRDEAISQYQIAEDIIKNGNESKNLKESMMLMALRDVSPDTEVVITPEDIDNQSATILTSNNSNATEPQDQSNLTPTQNIIAEASADYLPPSKLEGQLFRITDKSVYSKDNPVPINAKQPEGLVYKVQVGAFRNPLPPESFNKFAPVSGQVLSSGVTRYMVGYFTNFEPADNAKLEIHQIPGYQDAFVVAYLNGERISIERARVLEQEGVIPGYLENPQVTAANTVSDNQGSERKPDVNATNNSSSGADVPAVDNKPIENEVKAEETVIKPLTESDRQKASYYTSVPNAAPASQVEIIEGLFYTVQIGVYSQPVPSAELFDVSPLNSQLTKSGKIRYSTGIYTNLEEAVRRKNQLIEIGIVDAFVTAYYNGERITITASKELVAENGEAIFTSGKTMSENEGEPISRYNKENVYYRILLGKFENTVPSNVANYLFNDDNIFFETEIDADNIIYLYTQKFHDLNEVKKRLVEINELGFEDMEILSYYNLQSIPFEEAKKILENKPIEVLTEYDTPQGMSADNLFYEAEAIYYRVNIGKEQSEDNTTLAKLNELSDVNFELETTEDGDLIIHSENIGTFAEANSLLGKLNEANIPGAKIVAYHKYVQISIDKAMEIKGK
jgi:predicted  nucleic acid-binding Zn-ribbon protein